MQLKRLASKKDAPQPKTLRTLTTLECAQVAGGMKLITAVIKPFKLDDTQETLYSGYKLS